MARIFELIEKQAVANTTTEAFIDLSGNREKRLSYGELYFSAQHFAEKIRKMGLPAGSRAVLSGVNSPEWCIAYLGMHMAGLSIAPLDSELSGQEIDNILGFLKPELIACESATENKFSDVNLPNIFIESIGIYNSPLSGFSANPPDPDSAMSIVFTSGTTSQPKGVVLSENNFLHQLEVFTDKKTGLINSSDRLMNLLPLHHVYAFTCTFLLPLSVGATVIYPRSLKGDSIVEAAQRERVTIIAVVPKVLTAFHTRILGSVAEKGRLVKKIFHSLMKLSSTGMDRGWRPGKYIFRSVRQRMPSLRYFACGGAKLEESVHRDLASLGLTIIEAYGLSETSPVVTFNRLSKPIPGSVGKAVAGVELKIVKADKNVEEGEVWARGPNVMKGYLDNPEATSKVIDSEGWFRTGDLGHLDSEGNLFLSGRLKEVIVLPSGKNIYPEELEKVYNRCELAEEVCITALPPDQRHQQLTAIVVPDREALRRLQTPNLQEEIKFKLQNIAAALPSYNRVTQIIIRDKEFPRTRLGKLKRFQIIKELEKSPGETDSNEESTSHEPLIVFTRQYLSLKRDPTFTESVEMDLGLDSLAKLEYLSALENEFRIDIPDDIASTFLTLGDIQNLIIEQSGDENSVTLKDKIVPLEKRVDRYNSPSGNLVRYFARFVLGTALRIMFEVKITGAENIPRQGAFILAPNHHSYIDPVVIYGLFPFGMVKKLFWVATAQIFTHFPLSLCCYPGKIIQTGTVATTAQSLKDAYSLLAEGEPVCIFPEGKRSIDGCIDRAKPGIGRLSSSLSVPVIPVRINGTEMTLSRTNPKLRTGKITVDILPALEISERESEIREAWFRAVSREENP